ncbi:hypothetical protein MW887_008006 [Aspergillus wentii]|nr:hypothetical protein MW887_008006 [Aspergillus wentii]
MSTIVHPTNTTKGADHLLVYAPPLSSSDPIEFSDISEADFFMDSQLRAGGPYLVGLPDITTPIHPTHPCYDIYLNKELLMDGAKEYLDDAKIMYTEISIRQRWSKIYPEAIPIPTMVIYARRQSRNEQWREVAREIYAYFKRQGFEDLRVDIIDEELLKPKHGGAITKSDEIFSQQDQIEEEIWNILPSEKLKTVWCGRRGRKENNPPSIIVVFSLWTSALWQYDKYIDDIRTILICHDVTDTAIQFFKGDIVRGCDYGTRFSYGCHVPKKPPCGC